MTDKFHMVGLGVSESGQQGLLEFLQHLPAEPNMAFIVVHEAADDFDEIVARISAIQTIAIKTGTRIKKNILYIAPKNFLVSINNGRFQLAEGRGRGGAIDFFLASLAQDVGDKAVGVILSRDGNDGFAGLAEIDKYGGRTLIQSRAFAPFAPLTLPMATLDAVHPTLVASPATLALYLASFALLNEFKRESIKD